MFFISLGDSDNAGLMRQHLDATTSRVQATNVVSRTSRNGYPAVAISWVQDYVATHVSGTRLHVPPHMKHPNYGCTPSTITTGFTEHVLVLRIYQQVFWRAFLLQNKQFQLRDSKLRSLQTPLFRKKKTACSKFCTLSKCTTLKAHNLRAWFRARLNLHATRMGYHTWWHKVRAQWHIPHTDNIHCFDGGTCFNIKPNGLACQRQTRRKK